MVQKIISSLVTPNILSRYSIAGILNTGIALLTYWILIYINTPYYFASAMSLITGIIFSFNTHRHFVFREKGNFINYTLVWLFIYLINISLLGLLIKYINSYLAPVVLLPLNVILGIILMSLFVFRE